MKIHGNTTTSGVMAHSLLREWDTADEPYGCEHIAGLLGFDAHGSLLADGVPVQSVAPVANIRDLTALLDLHWRDFFYAPPYTRAYWMDDLHNGLELDCTVSKHFNRASYYYSGARIGHHMFAYQKNGRARIVILNLTSPEGLPTPRAEPYRISWEATVPPLADGPGARS